MPGPVRVCNATGSAMIGSTGDAMMKYAQVMSVCAALALVPGGALAEEPYVEEVGETLAQAQVAAPAEGPPAEAPAEVPPAPPPPSTSPAPQPQVSASLPPGQWVYTAQYGWIWMPYGDAYTYVPPNGYGTPYAYSYYPAYGWAWVAAPWVWGYGPWPYFGIYGAVSFGWYGAGYWRYPSYWHYHAPGRVAFPAPVVRRPVPGGTGVPAAPAPRPGVVRPAPRSGVALPAPRMGFAGAGPGSAFVPRAGVAGPRQGMTLPAPRIAIPAPRGAPAGRGGVRR
jgi:hypothetical protein